MRLALLCVVACCLDFTYGSKIYINNLYWESFVGPREYDPRNIKARDGSTGITTPVLKQHGGTCFIASSTTVASSQGYLSGVFEDSPVQFSNQPGYTCGQSLISKEYWTGLGNVDSYIQFGIWYESNWPSMNAVCGFKALAVQTMISKCTKSAVDLQDPCLPRQYTIPSSRCFKTFNYRYLGFGPTGLTPNGRKDKIATQTGEHASCRSCVEKLANNSVKSVAYYGSYDQCKAAYKRMQTHNVSSQDYCSCKTMLNSSNAFKIPPTRASGTLQGMCNKHLLKYYSADITKLKMPRNSLINNLLIARAIMEFGPIQSTVNGNTMSSSKENLFHSCDKTKNHFVSVVGFGMNTRREAYWIIQNSWGTAVGDKGFYYVPMGCNCHRRENSTDYFEECSALQNVNQDYFPVYSFKGDTRGDICAGERLFTKDFYKFKQFI
mmetsp:Transcript_24362/g.39503  ORF Transcript_24362/g.39503 Transcript_24362/m.39503 type:complete len:436 (+) Transcript_24362:310-1617(+)